MQFLKFPSEAAYLALLPATEPKPPEGLVVDVIGVITKADNSIPPVVTTVSGYHVNTVGPLPSAWAAYVISTPAQPVRVFLGWTA